MRQYQNGQYMVSFDTCLIGSAFIGGMIMTMMVDKTNDSVHRDYHLSLDLKQKEIYQKIKNERRTLHIQGMFLGLIFALIYHSSYPSDFDWNRSCTMTSIIMLTTHFYYTLSPKTTYMIEHLSNDVQIKLWNQVYQDMQMRYYGGMVLGMIGYTLLFQGMGMNFLNSFFD